MNTYVSLPIFRGLDTRGGKNYEQAHTHTRGTTTVTTIIIKFTSIGSSNVDRHIDRVSVAA